MPYPVGTDPQAVRDLQRKVRSMISNHLLWAFNPRFPTHSPLGRR